MNPQYISTLLILFAIDILFSTYLSFNASGRAYAIGFLLALASLFTFTTILYLPIFWIGFKYMRCFKFKTFVASLIGVLSVYWILLFFCLWLKDLDTFLAPFQTFYPILGNLYREIEYGEIVILGFFVVVLVITMIDYISNSYHDKIQIRASLSFLYLLTFLSIFSFLFVIYNPLLNIFVFLLGSSMVLSHFFSLAELKWKVTLFYIFISLYLIVFIYLLLNKVITAILAS